MTLFNFKYISALFVMGVILFTPHINFFGLFTLKTIFLFPIFLLYLVVVGAKIPKFFLKMYLISISLICLISFSSMYFSYEILRQISIFIVLSAVIFYFINNLLSEKNGLDKLFSLLSVCLIFQATVILLAAFVEGFAENFHSIFMLTERAERYITDNVLVNRYSGFSPSGFSILSMYMTFLLVLILNALHNQSVKSKFLHYFAIVITLISLIFVGRAGLYLSTIIIIIFFFIRFPIKSVITFSIVVLPVAIYNYSYFDALFNDDTLAFAFELFLSDDFSSVSTNTIFESELFIPSLSYIGSGRFTRAELGANTDLGWIVFLEAFGIIGTFILLGIFVYLLFVNTSTRSAWFPSSILFLALIIIGNFKDLYFLSSGFIQAIIILITLNYADYKRRTI